MNLVFASSAPLDAPAISTSSLPIVAQSMQGVNLGNAGTLARRPSTQFDGSIPSSTQAVSPAHIGTPDQGASTPFDGSNTQSDARAVSPAHAGTPNRGASTPFDGFDAQSDTRVVIPAYAGTPNRDASTPFDVNRPNSNTPSSIGHTPAKRILSPCNYPPIKEVFEEVQNTTGGKMFDIDPDIMAGEFEAKGATTVDQFDSLSSDEMRAIGIPLALERVLRDRAGRLTLLAEGDGVSQPRDYYY